ncbi:hypothetical protein JNUCC64_11245 [Streptomyces sp. JNUCC 64]
MIPFDIETFHCYTQSMLYAHGPIPQLDTVQIDNAYNVDFLHSEVQLSQCRGLAESASKITLDPTKSRDFIHKAIREL